MKRYVAAAFASIGIILVFLIVYRDFKDTKTRATEIDSEILRLESVIEVDNQIVNTLFSFTKLIQNKTYSISQDAIRSDHNKNIGIIKKQIELLKESVNDEWKKLYFKILGMLMLVGTNYIFMICVISLESKKKVKKRLKKKTIKHAEIK